MWDKRCAYLVALLCMPFIEPVFGHHSFAMFDLTKEVVLSGTVKDFQWTNPHTWIQVMAPDSGGKVVEWSIEGGSPNALARQGWRRSSLKAGDKISITINPLRDGTSGGALVRMKLADGTLLGKPEGQSGSTPAQ